MKFESPFELQRMLRLYVFRLSKTDAKIIFKGLRNSYMYCHSFHMLIADKQFRRRFCSTSSNATIIKIFHNVFKFL